MCWLSSVALRDWKIMVVGKTNKNSFYNRSSSHCFVCFVTCYKPMNLDKNTNLLIMQEGLMKTMGCTVFFSQGIQLWNCRYIESVQPEALVLRVFPVFETMSLPGICSILLRGMSCSEPGGQAGNRPGSQSSSYWFVLPIAILFL